MAGAEYEKLRTGHPSDFPIIKALVKVFNAVSEDDMISLLSALVESENDSTDASFQREVCALLAYLVCAQSRRQVSFNRVGLVVQTLLAASSKWLSLKEKARDCILDILLLYGCCNNSA